MSTPNPLLALMSSVLSRPFLSLSLLVLSAVASLLTYLSLSDLKRAKNPLHPPTVDPTTFLGSFLGSFRVFTFLEFTASPLKMIHRCYKAYGPCFTLNMFGQRITILLSPEAQEPFFKSNDSVLSQAEVYGFMKPVFGEGVVYDCPVRKRQVQFQSMSHGLRPARLKTYVDKIRVESENYFRSKLGASGTVDLQVILAELTILTASRCLHGDDVRDNMHSQIASLFHDLDKGIVPLSVFFPYAPTAAHAKRDKARIEMEKLFGTVIKARRQETPAEAAKANRTDVLDAFINTSYKDGTPLSDSDIAGLLIALLFAGQHTSSITSTWTAMFVMKDKKIMERVMAEQVAGGTKFDYDTIGSMELLHNCMREALRLHPPLVLLMRKVKEDLKFTAKGKDFLVPKGDTVMLSPSVGMRIPEVFPEPDRFDPDRFAPPREEHKQPYAYLGFGGGMHSCMGQAFAFVQVKTILSVMFSMYEMELVPEEMPECDYEAMVVGPKGDCRVRYKQRA